MAVLFKRVYVLLIILISSYSLYAENFLFKGDPLKLYKEASALFKNKKFKEAFFVFEKFTKEQALEFDVRNALFYMGRSKQLSGNYFDAIRYFSRLRNRYKSARYYNDAGFYSAVCFFKVGLNGKSIVYFRDYLRDNPKGSLRMQAYYYLGEINFLSKKVKKAAVFYSKIVSMLDKKSSAYQNKKKVKALKRKVVYRLGIIYARNYRNVPVAYKYLKSLLNDPGFKEKSNVKFILKDISFFRLSENNGLPENTVSAISFDGDDIWIGTWLSGIVRFSRSNGKFKYFTRKQGLVSNAVRSILIDFDEIWISTYDGISLYSKKTGKFKTLKGIKGKSPKLVQSIYKEGRNIYFASLTQGVFRFDRIKETWAILNKHSALQTNRVQKVSGNEDYTVFTTLNKGLVLYNKKNKNYSYINEASGLAYNHINDTLIDGRYLWIALHGKGLDRYDLLSKKIKHFSPSIKTVAPYPMCIKKRGHKIWVGTMGGGVNIYDLNKQSWERFSVIDGLPSNNIKFIEFEDDYVWLGTLDKGISIVYRPENE